VRKVAETNPGQTRLEPAPATMGLSLDHPVQNRIMQAGGTCNRIKVLLAVLQCRALWFMGPVVELAEGLQFQGQPFLALGKRRRMHVQILG
jgi:hypothetical protein